MSCGIAAGIIATGAIIIATGITGTGTIITAGTTDTITTAGIIGIIITGTTTGIAIIIGAEPIVSTWTAGATRTGRFAFHVAG